MAKSANSGPKSAEEQNAIRRAAKAQKRPTSGSGNSTSRGPRSSGNLFHDIRTDPALRTRRQKLNEFLSKNRQVRRQVSSAVLNAGFPSLGVTARQVAIRAMELYARTDPHVRQRGDGEIIVLASSFKLAAHAIRAEMTDHNREAVASGINAAGRALEAYRNQVQKAK